MLLSTSLHVISNELCTQSSNFRFCDRRGSLFQSNEELKSLFARLPSWSMWCSSCCELSTGSCRMSQNPWSWRSRGSATWPSRLWLKTKKLCWWVEAEGPPLPLQASPAQVSRTWDTHTHDAVQHKLIYKTWHSSSVGKCLGVSKSRLLGFYIMGPLMSWKR